MKVDHDTRKHSPSSPIRAVLSAPESEQLDLALEFINWFVPHNSSILAHYHAAFGLSYKEAQLVHLLARHAPHLVPYDTMQLALCADTPTHQDKSHQSIIYATRAKGIRTHTIIGYGIYMKEDEAKRVLPSLEPASIEPIPIEKKPFSDRRRRWTRDDDAWLRRNHDLGYSVAAQFLNRTVYAVQKRKVMLDQLSKLGLEPEY